MRITSELLNHLHPPAMLVPPLPKRARDFGSVLQRMLVRWFLLVNNSLRL